MRNHLDQYFTPPEITAALLERLSDQKMREIAHTIEHYRDALDNALDVVNDFKFGDDTRAVDEAISELHRLGYVHLISLYRRYSELCLTIDEESKK